MALVVSGKPDEDALREAKMNILTELSYLLGSTMQSKINNILARIYAARALITGLAASKILIESGDTEAVIDFLKRIGIRGEAGILSKKIDSKISQLRVTLKTEYRQYEEEVAKNSNIEITEEIFNDQLIILSKDAGFRLTKEITLAEYAGYLKEYNRTIKAQNNAKHRPHTGR